MSMRGTLGRIGFAVCLVAALGVQAPARADFQTCTKGDAQLNLSAGPSIVGAVWIPGRGGAGNAVDAVSTCRYNVFADGETFTFTADDWFVGQITWLDPYKADGIPRSEAVANIKLGVDRVWLAPVLPDGSIGPLVEQTLHYSAFKDTFRPCCGHMVYQERAFAAQLPPGEYVSIWLSQYPGEPDQTATVYLHITP
jgi:hypothetical protein